MEKTRIAGIVAAVGAAGGAVFAAMELVAPSELTLAVGLRNCLFHIAAIVGVVALAMQGAVGRGWVGRVGIGGAVIGFALLCVAEVTDPFDPTIAEPIYQASPLIIGVAFILAGVAVLRERRWTGWRRLVPLVCGLYPFVAFLPLVIALGDDPGLWIALVGWELTLLALATSVIIEARAGRPARADAPRARVG